MTWPAPGRRFDFAIGEGLRLERLEPEHAPELLAVLDRERASLRRWMPAIDGIRTLDDALEFAEVSARSDRSGPLGHERLLMEGQRIVGGIGLNELDWSEQSGNLGYWLVEAARGRGLMTRAARRMVAFGFEVMGLDRIEIRCRADNLSAIRVGERAGFRREDARVGDPLRPPRPGGVVVLERRYSD